MLITLKNTYYSFFPIMVVTLKNTYYSFFPIMVITLKNAKSCTRQLSIIHYTTEKLYSLYFTFLITHPARAYSTTLLLID